QRQAVQIQGEAGVEAAGIDPGPERLAVGQPGTQAKEVQRHPQRRQGRQAHRAHADGGGQWLLQAATGERQQEKADQGKQDGEKEQVHPRISLALSVSRLWKRRWIWNTNARPMAASDAARVSTRMNMICPSGC